MREQLEQYVNLLFAGSLDAEDMRQEILQNTLDRYDDLIEQGKTPEAAYRLAIAGIGDVNELLGASSPAPGAAPTAAMTEEPAENGKKKWMRALAIAMYICSAIPLFILGNIGDGVIGLSITCLLVAAATALIVMSSDKDSDRKESNEVTRAQDPKRKAIADGLSTGSLVLFLVLSFLTGAWHITWLVFPIMGAVRGIVFACMDLKEAIKHEA